MNIFLSFIGLGGIIVATYLSYRGPGIGIKSHLLILLWKLMVSSLIIGLFLIYAEKHIWIHLILSGMINIIIFHFIEAFATQKKMLHKRRVSV